MKEPVLTIHWQFSKITKSVLTCNWGSKKPNNYFKELTLDRQSFASPSMENHQ
jgi:hypothetical protein